MTPLDYLTYFFCGLLGISIMVLVKLRALKERSKIANTEFSVISYFKDDLITLLLALVSLLVLLIGGKYIAKYKPDWSDWLWLLFVLWGYAGTSILLAFFSKAEAKINRVIDIKTDIADGK